MFRFSAARMTAGLALFSQTRMCLSVSTQSQNDTQPEQKQETKSTSGNTSQTTSVQTDYAKREAMANATYHRENESSMSSQPRDPSEDSSLKWSAGTQSTQSEPTQSRDNIDTINDPRKDETKLTETRKGKKDKA